MIDFWLETIKTALLLFVGWLAGYACGQDRAYKRVNVMLDELLTRIKKDRGEIE
jgi:hypothetical protein